MAPNFVLGSSKSSTYPTREKSCSDSSGLGGWECYAFGLVSPAAFPENHFEQPLSVDLGASFFEFFCLFLHADLNRLLFIHV